jgi:hypothetical protein
MFNDTAIITPQEPEEMETLRADIHVERRGSYTLTVANEALSQQLSQQAAERAKDQQAAEASTAALQEEVVNFPQCSPNVP